MQPKIWNNSGWIKKTDPTELREECAGILRACGFNVLKMVEHHFTPYGYTALWLLGESHFAIHTFPEYGRTYYELSSCNMDYYVHFLTITRNW